MRPIIDADLCIGCGLCEQTCPEVFRLNDAGIAEVIDPDPGPGLHDRVAIAAEDCPVEAISIEK